MTAIGKKTKNRGEKRMEYELEKTGYTNKDIDTVLAKPLQNQERKDNIILLTVLQSMQKELARLNEVILNCKQRINDLENKLRTPKPAHKTIMIVLGIFAIIGGIALFAIPSFDNRSLPIVLLVLGAILLVTDITVTAKKRKAWSALMDQYRAELEIAKADLSMAEANRDQFLCEVMVPYAEKITPDRFPAKLIYNELAVNFMLECLICLRCDTIKEALNGYYEELFRRQTIGKLDNMEQYLIAISHSTARAAEANERSAAANERSAAANEAAAIAAASMARSAQRMANAQERSASASESVARKIDSM